jgi:hypothetical protein
MNRRSAADRASVSQPAPELLPPGTERDRIAERAYTLYLQRGPAEGDAVSDWLEAERQIREADGRRTG